MAVNSFKEIEQDMRSKISYGKWAPGAPLPSRRDLAKEYGVTCVTIQRAIAGLIADGTVLAHPRKGTFVSGEAAAQRAGGSSAPAATGKRPVIGIIAELPVHGSPRSDGSYFENRIAVQAVEQVYSEQGLTTRFINILQPNDKHLHVDEAIDQLVAENVDGIVVVFCDELDKVKRVYAASRRIKVPLVYVASRELMVPISHVYFDNRDAGFQAAQHLIDQGCTSIAMFAPFIEDWAQERSAGIRHAIATSDLSPRSVSFHPQMPLVAQWNLSDLGVGYEENKRITQAEAYQCAKEFFGAGPAPDGIIAANDHVAFGIIQAAEEFSKFSGRDYLLVGFDDVPDSRMVNLSTLRPPLEWMGYEAANLLLQSIQGRQSTRHIKLRSHLVTRASTNNAGRRDLVSI
jgi:DNA-binding LacI/PurR family transcriptional regulator